MSATLTGTRGWLRDRARERESDEEAAGGRQAFPLTLALAMLALVWLIPFFFVVTTAIRGQGELLSSGPFSIPKELRLDNFVKAWDIGNFSTYYRNSLIVTGLKVPLGILVASLAAYPLAKLRFPLRDQVFLFLLLGLAIPIHVTLLPIFTMLREMGINNTLAALFPPYLAFGLPLHIFILRGYFRSIPDDLREAALIDGASEWQIYWRITMPLAVPALATVFIIDALATWNELLIALVLLSSESVRTVPLGLLNFQGQFSSQMTALNAGILIGIAPVLIVYVLFQRYMVSGLTAGAIKG
jgi:raffinose/stachyose/melibiose transport system permease protein